MKKLFAFDLDGTLLKNDKSLSAPAVCALTACLRAGHTLCIATGRPPRDVRGILPPALADIPLVCYNGARIYQGNVVLFSRTISRRDALEILSLAEKANIGQVFFEIDDVLHANFDLSAVWTGAKTAPEDLAALSFAGVHKVIACASPAAIAAFASALPADVPASVTDADCICQIAPKGVSKASGVRFLAEREGISMRDAVAFGDDANDIEMLKECGIGVAMGNASAQVKAAAKYIAESNEEDGVAKFLRQYCKI